MEKRTPQLSPLEKTAQTFVVHTLFTLGFTVGSIARITNLDQSKVSRLLKKSPHI